MGKEIEIRRKAHDSKILFEILNRKGKKLQSDIKQKDIYYTPKHRNFLEENPIKEWFRVRETVRKSQITYKNWKMKDGETTNVCTELESEISNLSEILQILTALDFEEIVTVEKIRNTWMYKGIEIDVDEVKDLGTYVELENKELKGSDEEILEKLNSTAKELNLTSAEEVKLGYPIALLNK